MSIDPAVIVIVAVSAICAFVFLICLVLRYKWEAEFMRRESAKFHYDDDMHAEIRREEEEAWIIIANAHGGNWEKASPEWKAAAEKWRDAYHANKEARSVPSYRRMNK